MELSGRADTRTLAQLAEEALNVQNASNLAGVLLGWHRSYCRLRELLGRGEPTARAHPITALWADKVADMLRAYPAYDRAGLSKAYAQCEALAAR